MSPEARVAETNYTVAPGEYLAEWIEQTGTSYGRTRRMLDLHYNDLLGLLNGSLPVTEDVAQRLESVVGIPARTWLRYENAYRTTHASSTTSIPS